MEERSPLGRSGVRPRLAEAVPLFERAKHELSRGSGGLPPVLPPTRALQEECPHSEKPDGGLGNGRGGRQPGVHFL